MCVLGICEAHLSVAKLLLQHGALSKCKDEVRVVHCAMTCHDKRFYRRDMATETAVSGWIYCVGTV